MKVELRLLCAVMGFAVALGCAHTQPQSESDQSSPNKSTQASEPPPPSSSTSTVARCSSDNDCPTSALCIRDQCVPISLGLAECKIFRVHFDFNKSDLRDEDKAGLLRISRCLRTESALRVTIEGNADERGPEEYNLALGQRRAAVVEKYLENLGVNSDQLKTVTYGYEKPICTEHNEGCWSVNRRAAVKSKE